MRKLFRTVAVNCRFEEKLGIYEDTDYITYREWVNSCGNDNSFKKSEYVSAYLDNEGDWIGVKNEDEFEEMKVFGKENGCYILDIQLVNAGERIRQVELVDLKSVEEWSEYITLKLMDLEDELNYGCVTIKNDAFNHFMRNDDSTQAMLEKWLTNYPHRRKGVYTFLRGRYIHSHDFFLDFFNHIEAFRVIASEVVDGSSEPVYQSWITTRNGDGNEKPTDTMHQELDGIVVHDGVECNGCNQVPIRGCRYKSSKMMDFDLCPECKNSGKYDLNGPFIKFEMEQPCRERFVHHDIQCEGCLACSIVGPRFASLTVQDFNLCWVCEKKSKYTNVGPFVKLYDENDITKLYESAQREYKTQVILHCKK